MNLKKGISYYFGLGLLFVMCAYAGIKLVDQYQIIFNVLYRFVQATFPFFLGFILAYILHPIMTLFEKKLKFNRGMSVLLTYGAIILACFITLAYLTPVIYRNALDIVNETPYYLQEIDTWVNDLSLQISWSDLTILEGIEKQLTSIVPQITQMLTNSISSVFEVTVRVISTVGNTLLAFIISIYILLEKEQFLSIVHRLTVVVFKPRRANTMIEVTRLLHQNIGKYLVGKGVNSILVGLLAITGLWLIGAKYAVLLGVVFGVTNMIPIVGPIFGTIIAVGINLFYSPAQALVILIYLIIVQQIEAFLIDPKVVGHQLGLSPFFSLLAVTVGGHFFGVTGMILSVPIMGILKKYASQALQQQYSKLVISKVSPSQVAKVKK